MNKRVLLILLVIFIALLSVFGYLTYQDRKPKQAINPSPSVSPDKLTAISMTQGDSSVSITKENGVWMVDGYPADTQRLKKLLDAINDQTFMNKVSDNPDNFANYAVATPSAVLLQLSPPDTTITIGKYGTLSMTYYERFDEKSVYLYQGDLKNMVNANAYAWIDRVVVSTESDKITKITVSGTKDITLTKDISGWTKEQNGKTSSVDTDTVAKFFPQIAELSATDVNKNNAKGRGTTYTITIYTGDNQISFTAQKSDSSNYVVTRSSDSVELIASSPVLDALISL